MTKRIAGPPERYDVVEAVRGVLTKKKSDDGTDAAQLAAVEMIRGALLYILDTEGEATIWDTMTEIAGCLEHEIKVRSIGYSIEPT